MWDWIDQGAGLWGFLALVLAVIFGIPGTVDLFVTVRDWNRSTSDLHEALRGTKGRVRGDGLRSRAIGSDNSFEAIVTIDDQPYPASEHIYRRLAEGSSVVIIGEAGAGKSELLEELHSFSYRLAIEAADPLIEVVSLAALGTPRTRANLHAGSVRVIASRYRISQRAVQGLIAESRIIVAFDGLDEVREELRLEFTHQLTDLARQFPVVVSTRPVSVRSEGSEELRSAPDVLEAGGLERAHLQPLNWSFVEAALSRRNAPVPLATDQGAGQLQNPLLLQIVLYLWRRKKLDESAFLGSLKAPRFLLRQFVLGAVPVGKDKALRFVGVMAAAYEKSTEAPFKVFPLLLAGRAFTATALLAVAAVAFVGLANELWVTAPALMIALVSGSPYSNSSIIGRMLSGWTGSFGWWAWLMSLLYGFVVANVVRITSWSLQAGHFSFGSWKDLVSVPTLILAVWVTFFTLAPPMQLGPNPYTYTRYMQRHAWPICALFVAVLLFAVVTPGSIYAVFPLVVYLGTTCIYLAVSLLTAWRICDVPPWKWKSLVQELESRGIVTRTGSTIKLVHREIEEVILRDLAADGATPRLLWASFNAEWKHRLISVDPLTHGDTGDSDFSETIRRLARRDAWAQSTVSDVFRSYQWLRIEPAAALSLLKLHLRLLPFSSLRVLLPDALDRTGRDGLSLARRFLSRKQKNVFSMHWPLRVIERHAPPTELIELYRDLERRHASSPEIADALTSRRLNLLLRDLAPGDEQALFSDIGTLDTNTLDGFVVEKAAIVLERGAPDPVRARKLLTQERGSLAWAKEAQSLLLEKQTEASSRAASVAVSRLSISDGYLTALEVMVTALITTGSSEAETWVGRAFQSGLRIEGRPGLRRNLSIPVDSLASRLFNS